MKPLAKLLLSVEKRAQECRFEEEREDSFHRESLPDHGARVLREHRPVVAELELHRNSSHDTDDKIYSKNARPKARSLVVMLIFSSNRERLEYDNEQPQTHRQLGKQVVKRDRKRELNPVNEERIHIKHPIPNAEESEWMNPLSSEDRGSARASDSTRPSPHLDCALTATPQT